MAEQNNNPAAEKNNQANQSQQQPVPMPAPAANPVETLTQIPGTPTAVPEQPAPLPSTTEAQKATEDAQTRKKIDEVEKQEIQKYRSDMLKKGGPELTDVQIKRRLIAAERKKAQREVEEKQDQLKEQMNQAKFRLANVDDEIANIQEDIKYASGIGISTNDLEEERNKLLEEKQNLELALAPVIDATPEDATAATTPSKADIIEAGKQVREDAARVEAAQQVQGEQLAKKQQRAQRIQQEITKENERLQSIDPNRFWKSRSTGQKILAGLAMALGGVGAGLTGQQNQAANIIMNAINQDIEAQKLERKEALAMAENGLDRTLKQLRIQGQQLNNAAQIQKLQALSVDLEQRKAALNQQRELEFALEYGEALPPEAVQQLSEDQRERIVRMEDGSIQLADSKGAAREVRKYMGEALPARDDLAELLDMARSGEFSRLDPRDRMLINQKRQQLVGRLRLQLVGPGALTEREIDLIERTIGNPNNIFFQGTEIKKIESLVKTANNAIKRNLMAAGVKPPTRIAGKTIYGADANKINEANIKRAMSQNPNASKESIITELKKRNLWAK